MAKNILGSSQNDKAVHVLGLFSFLLLIQKGGASEFKVGGSSGWTVPTDSNRINYNKWAEDNRFQIGDTLLFVYPANNDSVLHVNKDDYTNCNPDKPISTYADGHTVFKLDRSGLFYFISGTKENCLKHEKLVVAVLADRSNNSSKTNDTTVASPPPSPSEITPSPAPAGVESPPPPGGSVEIIPSAGPTTEQPPPPNGVSSTVMSFVGSIGAFLGSSLLLAF